jgi:hypothetical protein
MQYTEGGKQVKVGISQGLPSTSSLGAPAAGSENVRPYLQEGRQRNPMEEI